MNYQERRVLAKKRLADHLAGKQVYVKQATRGYDAAREASEASESRRQRVEDNGITWRG